MGFDWVSYFSSKRSDHLNAIIGVWISFVFGFVSILSTEPTATILAFIAFLMLIFFIALYFFQKYRFYDAWEWHAHNNEIEFVDYETKYKKLLNPESGICIPRILYYITPRTVLELILQCLLWGGFVVVLLLWENNTLQWFLQSLSQVYWEPESIPLKFGPRHLIFIASLVLSAVFRFCFFLYNNTGEKEH